MPARTCCRSARARWPARRIRSTASTWRDLLGFSAVSRNSLDAVSDRDFLVEHLSALATLAMHLSRLAEELVLWSTAEFGFVALDESFTTGSSIMPQKRNPDVAELLRGKTGRVYGALVSLLVTLKGLPMSYNRDLQEDKAPYFEAVDVVHDGLALAAAMIEGATWLPERLAQAAADPLIAATDLADHLDAPRAAVPPGARDRRAHRARRRGQRPRAGRFFARRAAGVFAGVRGVGGGSASRRPGRGARRARRHVAGAGGQPDASHPRAYRLRSAQWVTEFGSRLPTLTSVTAD